MAQKRVALTTKPRQTEQPASADQWVESRTTETTKRLTLDIPASLHARIKSTCALRGVKMADDLRELLERHYPG